MFDFRIAYSGFAGLIFLFLQVIERFTKKKQQFLHNKVIYLDPHEYAKQRK